MKIARKLSIVALAGVSAAGYGQVPDLLTSFDAGGRAFGSAGNTYVTSADTLSATHNPAGLGYLNQSAVGISGRTYPTTRTFLSGPLSNPRLNTIEEEGDIRFSHVGFAKPLGSNRGTIGVAWTVGGWMHDDQFGFNLEGGIETFLDSLRIRTDFINFSWGKASADQTSAFGFGIVVAANSIYNRRFITFSDPNIPPVSARSDETSYGVGVQGGFMFTPRNQPNLTIGIMARTPIEMTDDGGAIALYDRIPGELSIGAAFRQDGYRGGKDYIVYGGQLNAFFGSGSSDRVPRDDHAHGHIGFEYNYHMSSFVIPIRFGYNIVPAGGDNFDDRNSFTYGIGYRPNNKPWSVDLAYGNAKGGVNDMAITLGVRF
jgi:hypothetical protein